MTLPRRWLWMSRKDDFRHIADITMRLQTRRIACDVANILLYVLSSHPGTRSPASASPLLPHPSSSKQNIAPSRQKDPLKIPY